MIYMGNTINHYKDPYLTTSIMESKKVFFVAQMVRWCFFEPSLVCRIGSIDN